MDFDYSDILSKLLYLIDVDKTNFRLYCEKAFNLAYQKNNKNGINKLFIEILQYQTWNLNKFKIMIELGADPKYDNDRPFVIACSWKKSKVAIYFIDNYHIDIPAIIDNYGIISIDGSSNTRILKMLLDNQIELNDKLISQCIHSVDKIKMIMAYGAELPDIIIAYNKENVYSQSAGRYILDLVLATNYYYDTGIITDFLKKIGSIRIKISLSEFKHLIELGADCKIVGDHIFPILCYRKPEETSILLYLINEIGIDINVNKSGAFIQAIQVGNYAIAQILLEAGIDVTDLCIITTNNHGQINLLTPYVCPERIFKVILGNFEKRHLKSLKFILENDGDINQIINGLID